MVMRSSIFLGNVLAMKQCPRGCEALSHFGTFGSWGLWLYGDGLCNVDGRVSVDFLFYVGLPLRDEYIRTRGMA